MSLHEVYLAAQIANKNNSGNIDLSDYYTKSQTDKLISGKVDKISNMGHISDNFQIYCTGSQAITQTILNRPADVNDNRFTLET